MNPSTACAVPLPLTREERNGTALTIVPFSFAPLLKGAGGEADWGIQKIKAVYSDGIPRRPRAAGYEAATNFSGADLRPNKEEDAGNPLWLCKDDDAVRA